MNPDIESRLSVQEQKIDIILTSVQKTEKYFKVTMWVTVILFVLPLVLMLFAVPAFIGSYTTTMESFSI